MAKRPPIPFKEIADQALLSALDLLERWLPDGKKQGGEYLARSPYRADRNPSLSINLTSGLGADFSAQENFKDLIALYAYLENIEMWEAAIDVADQIGFVLPKGCRPDEKPITERKPRVVDPATVPEKPPAEESPWQPILPVPSDATERPKAHIKRGRPERVWTYYDAEGRVLCYLYRFKRSEGGKVTITFTWCKNIQTGEYDWHPKQMPEPRPLYGLDRLAARPKNWILLVSGEKCADAPLNLLPNAVVVTWPGGDNAVDKVDWAPLANTDMPIYAWADCDAQKEKLSKDEASAGVDPESKPLLPEEKQSGMKAMLKIREKLRAINPAVKFKLVDIPLPGQKEGGWDIADAIDEGMDGPALLDFIRRTRPDVNAQAPVDQAKESPKPKIATTAKAEGSGGYDNDDWRDELIWSKKELVDCRENVFTFLNGHPDLKGMLGHDLFASAMVKRKPAPWDRRWEEGLEWSDNDNLELSLWLSRNAGYQVRGVDTINNAAKLAASRNEFNPVIEQFESYEWDRIDRLKTWLNVYAGVKQSKYSELVGTMFLISLPARVYTPGCIMRAMPVFEGQQFRGKSSILRILGGRWFSDSQLDLKGKDGFINIQGILLQEIPELGSFNNADANIIKAYISSASDRFRSPFDKHARQYKRQTVMAGTTNEQEYLKDKTGNTRFWPIRTEEVGNIDLAGLEAIRPQLIAEAVYRFKAGERWHPTAEEQLEYFTPEQAMRETEDPWETLISKYLHSNLFMSTTVAEILSDCLKVESSKMTPYMASQVGKIMNRLGWTQSRPNATDGQKRARQYNRPADDKPEPPKDVTPSGYSDDDPIPF